MNPKFHTTAAYVSGGICGHMWWPQELAGKPFKQNARGMGGFMDRFSTHAGTTFRDGLLRVLMEEGGDFQHAQFTADTEIVIERVRVDGDRRSTVHVRRFQVAKLEPDLVNDQAFTGDFLAEDWSL